MSFAGCHIRSGVQMPPIAEHQGGDAIPGHVSRAHNGEISVRVAQDIPAIRKKRKVRLIDRS